MSEHPHTGADDLDRPAPPRAPRWVKVSGVLAAGLALVIIVVVLIGGGPGGHGPGRHSSSVGETSTEPGHASSESGH